MTKGFILRISGTTNYFVSSIKGDLQTTRDRNYAWHTVNSTIAARMLMELDKQGVEVELEDV